MFVEKRKKKKIVSQSRRKIRVQIVCKRIPEYLRLSILNTNSLYRERTGFGERKKERKRGEKFCKIL